MLLKGTRKVAFLVWLDESRREWVLGGLAFKGCEGNYVACVHRSESCLFLAGLIISTLTQRVSGRMNFLTTTRTTLGLN